MKKPQGTGEKQMLELKARAKVNLSLDVTGKRADGYHFLRMVMQSVDIYDTLTFMRSKKPGIHLKTNVPSLVDEKKNLVWRAADLLLKRFQIREGVDITLTKRIPAAAGLAGGSADAAASLQGVSRLFGLNLSVQELCEYGVGLGADVPFCIVGGTALCEGVGEKITTLPPLPSCWIVLAKPTVGVSTPYAYRRLDEIGDYPHPDVESQVAAIRAGDLTGVIAAMGNVLEEVAAPEVPAIGQIEDYLRQNGAMAAMMSGSGSTVFGIFSEKEDAQKACDGLELNGLAKDVFLTVPFQGQEEHA
jgi:4-diphosphocytidyl-2-C-methyl-D-erythritol kinase